MSALKVIPWSDVIEATPGLVKGARKIFARSQTADASPPDHPPAAPVADVHQRVVQLEASLTELSQQQRASAELVSTLAEQNARIVQVVDVLRVRVRVLMAVSAALAVVLAGVIVWSVR